jgi:hypothetical protein
MPRGLAEAVSLASGRPAGGRIAMLGTGALPFHAVAPSRFLIRTRL